MLNRHLVEEDSENTFLHFSCILSTEDDHFLVREVYGYRGSRSHALGISIGREGSSVINSIIRMEMLEVFPVWSDEHVAHEESVIGPSTNDSNFDSVFLVPSCKPVDNVDAIPRVQVIDCSLSVNPPDLRGVMLACNMQLLMAQVLK